MSEETGSILTRPQLEHAVRRNFSGFDEFDTVAKFQDLKVKIYIVQKIILFVG